VLWLNEGFAEFTQYLVTAYIFPELNVMQHFFSTEHEDALCFDASEYSHPIEPRDFEGFLFDDITYNKAASILRMLYQYMEANTLNATASLALKNYLQEHSFGSVTTADLMSSLSLSTGLDLQQQFGAWITTKGFPVVKLSISKITNNTITFFVTQEKFQVWKDKSHQHIWPIIINAALIFECHGTSHSTMISISVNGESGYFNFIIPNGFTFQFLLVNPDRIWFYRTMYSADLLDRLLPEIPGFNIADKCSLISDFVSLTIAGYYKIDSLWLDTLFKRLNFVTYDSTPAVWESFLMHTGRLEVATRSTVYHDSFLKHMHLILEKIIRSMTWRQKYHPLITFKSEIFLSAIKYEHIPTVQQAIAFFNSTSYDPLLHRVVLEASIRFNNQFDQVWRVIQKTQNLTWIPLLAATSNTAQQKLLVASYIKSVHLNDILHTFLYYGSYDTIWATIKEIGFANNSKFESLLEDTITQFQSKRLLRDARRRKGKGILRGIEKANALRQFRASL
jgi:hypothetical protein